MSLYASRDEVEAELRDAIDGGNVELIAFLAAELDALDVPPPPVPVLAAALWYAEQGIPVFPLQPRAKTPFPRTRGVNDASLDPATIRGWFGKLPDANLGLATGHKVDVIDFDGAKAHAAWPFPTWDAANVTVLGTVSTPRPGGLHVYVPSSGKGNKAGIYPGVDFRGRGGYVLAPPSVLDNRPGQHPGSYRFLRPLTTELP